MAKTPLVGTAYTDRSKNLADQRCINLFPGMVETKSGKAVGGLYGTPGLDFLVTADSGPIRGVHVLESSNTLYVVSGSSLYSVNTSFVASLVGTLTTNNGPVTMIDNGQQLAVSDGANLYAVSGGAFSTVAIPAGPPGQLTYQDTLGVYNQVGSKTLWQSNVNDLTTWTALNFNIADGSPEPIVGLTDFHRQIVVFKANHTEFWVNAGNPGFVFQRLEGVFLEAGCAAPNSIAKVAEQILWLGRNSIGQGIVYVAKGYESVRISTYAIEHSIAGYATISDAIGWGYSQEGHTFYVLTFPTGGETWVLDVGMTGHLGVPAWHQRAGFFNGAFTQYEPSCAALFAGKVVVGSGSGGNLYALNLDTYTDNGAPRKWLRSWRGVAVNARQSQRFNFLELEYESGFGVPQAANPQFVLRYSDDAHTWSNEIFAAAGQTGQVASQTRFNRLGTVRRGSNTDRVFELSSTDPFKVAITGADIT